MMRFLFGPIHTSVRSTWLLLAFAAASRPAHAGAAAEQAISSIADSSQAAMAASQFRTRLASERDTTVRGDLHYGLFRMLLLTRAPADTILAEAESSAFAYRSRPNMLAEIHRAVAETFLGRHERLDEVKRRAIAAEALLATAPDGAPYRATALALRARAQGLAGSPDSAATTMRRALAVLPDGIPPTRQDLEFRLGGFEQAAGRDSLALAAYLRSAGTYLGHDSSAAAPLRSLWTKAHGSLAGLDEALAAALAASRQQTVFDSRRDARPLPEFRMEAMSGAPFTRASLVGRVSVIDFWGTWCGPCRVSFPHLQSLYERWKDKGVVFMAADVEYGQQTVAGQRKIAADFMSQNHYTIPVALETDGVLAQPLAIENYPTTLVVDAIGVVRYRNIGYMEGLDRILDEQIASLVAIAPAHQSARPGVKKH